MTRYAANTEVSSERSKAEIERTLARYGANQFMYGWQTLGAVIGFRIGGRMFRIDIPMPDRNSRAFQVTDTGRARKSQETINAAYEQAIKQRWRAAALYIKATLEAVESGITTLESAFLANTLLPSGETFGSWAAPQIEQVYLTGSMPALLPGLPAPKEQP